MWTMLGRSLGLVLLIATLVHAGPLDRVSHSATIATQLAKALSEQGLDAIAAQDPDEPDRFIAALFFEDTQLLVVSARYASPLLMKARLAHKQYRDVYLDLSGSSIADTSFLFQDMNADGLCTRREQAADIVYDGSQAAKIFDGDWSKHKSDDTYEQQFVVADQRYSRLLNILWNSCAQHLVQRWAEGPDGSVVGRRAIVSSLNPLRPVRSGLLYRKLGPRLDGRRMNAVLTFPAGSPLWMFGGFWAQGRMDAAAVEKLREPGLGSSPPGGVAIPPKSHLRLGQAGQPGEGQWWVHT